MWRLRVGLVAVPVFGSVDRVIPLGESDFSLLFAGNYLWVPGQRAHLSRYRGFDVSNQAFFDKQNLIPIARTVDVIPRVPVPVVAPGG